MNLTKASILFLFVCATTFQLFSCKKDKGNNPAPENKDQSVFIINGVTDVTFTSGAGALALEIQHVSGTQSVVDLSLTDLPSGVTASFTAASGTPTFGTGVTFSTTGELGGSYPVKLHATNGITSKEYNFKLHLEQAEDCRNNINNAYTATDWCIAEDTWVYVQTVKDPDIFNRMHLNMSDYYDHSVSLYSIYMDLNCFTNEIKVPAQMINNMEVSGVGAFSADAIISLALKIKDPSGNVSSCDLTMMATMY